MKRSGKTDPFEEEHPLDVAIAAAFGASAVTHPQAAATSSVLHVVGQTQKVPHVLLHEIESDDTSLVQCGAKAQDTPGYPAQIDRYHVIGEIARGGVGLILKARDLDLGREVALKVLLDKYRGDPEMTHRFLEEAQIGGQLQHPGILPVHEIGLYDVDRPYLAMKFVRGQTLAERLESRAAPHIERQRFLGVFEQVCQTMAYAHSKRVVHRDLKPSNVMVGSFGEVQIMDWGLAKVLPRSGLTGNEPTSRVVPADHGISTWRSEEPSSDSLAGSVMGTPAYMPPEQANGRVEAISERSDVFGLGAILCEILTGKPPYAAGSAGEILQKAKEADLEDALARLHTCGADEELIEIARSCLQVNASDRPRNAIVVANRMQFYLESLETRARQLEVRTAKTRSRLVLALFVILALVLGGGSYVLVEREREKQEAISLTAADKACIEAEKLSAQAAVSGELATWEAALREAGRALELADRSADEGIEERATRLRGTLEAKVEAQRVLSQLERLKEDRGSRNDELQRSLHEVFSSIGVELETLSVQEAATILRGSTIQAPLVLALDQWIDLIKSGALKKKLFDLAQAVDGDAWRKRLRAALLKADPADLSRLAEEAEVRELAPSTFDLLARKLSPRRWPSDRERPFERSAKAERLWRRAQEVHPDDFWINVHLGRFLRDEGAYDEALQSFRIAVALRPRNGYARRELGSVLAATGNAAGALRELRRSIRFDPDSPKGYAYYEASRTLEKSGPEVPNAEIETLLQTLQSIRESGNPFHLDGLIQLLARCQFATGDIGGAVLTLEDSVRHRGTPVLTGPPVRGRMSRTEQLREYRLRLLPDLVSYASIDSLFESRLPAGRQAEVIDRFRKLHETKEGGVVPRIAYLDARSLQGEGRLAEAISRFRRVLASDQTLPEPFFHFAACLRARGESDEAEHVLREALKSLRAHCPALWNLWVEIAFADLKWSARELLDVFPVASDAILDGVASYSQDILWLLKRLASGTPILINCGGADYQALSDGSLWSRDRFFSWQSGTYLGQALFLGRVYFGEIAGTDHDPLYQTERWFPPNAGPSAGYRIPLPLGKYEVALHFAEIFEHLKERGANSRSFDIRVEGETVRAGYEPLHRGFAVADHFTVETPVEDGFLDIEFAHRSKRDNPKISAIAVRPVD